MKMITLLFMACVFFLLSPGVFADDTILILNKALGPETPVAIAEVPEVGTGATAVEKVSFLFFLMVRFILYIVGIGAVIMIVYAGFRMTASAGGEALEVSKKTIIHAVLGLFAVILALMVVETIVRILA